MSDDAGLIPLETDDAPAPVAEPPAPVAAAPDPPPPAPVAAPPPDQEPGDSQSAGLLRDLRAERGKSKELEGKLGAAMTVIQRLQGRPDVLAMLDQPMAPPPPPPAPKTPEPPESEMYDLARSLSLYGADGQPDRAAAGRVYTMMAKNAQAIATAAARDAAESAVQPLRTQAVNSQAAQLRQEALQTLAAFEVDANTAAPLIDQLPPELQANPASMVSAVLMSIGLAQVQKRNGARPAAAPAAKPPAAPVFVEGHTAKPTAPVMTAGEIRAAKAVGANAANWHAVTANATKNWTEQGFHTFDGEE